MTPAEFWAGRFVVYRCYDADGEPLYIGCTRNWDLRQRTHASSPESRPWAYRVARIKITLHPSIGHARAAEFAAIRAERPAFNIYGRGPRIGWTERDYEQVIAALEVRPVDGNYHLAARNRQATLDRLRAEYAARFGQDLEAVPA